MDHAVATALLDMSRARDANVYWGTVSDYLNEFAMADRLRVMRRKNGIIDENETTIYDTTDQQWRQFYQENGFKYIDPLARTLHLKQFGVFCWGSEKVKSLHVPETPRLQKAIKNHAMHAGAFGAHVNFPADGYTLSMSATFASHPEMVETRVTGSSAMLEKFLKFAALFHEHAVAQKSPDGSYFDRLVVQLLMANGMPLKEIEKFGLLGDTGAVMENPLSERQREILLKVADGQSTKEIAYDLGVTERVVNHALNQAKSRLGARNRTQAVLRASSLGLLQPD